MIDPNQKQYFKEGDIVTLLNQNGKALHYDIVEGNNKGSVTVANADFCAKTGAYIGKSKRGLTRVDNAILNKECLPRLNTHIFAKSIAHFDSKLLLTVSNTHKLSSIIGSEENLKDAINRVIQENDISHTNAHVYGVSISHGEVSFSVKESRLETLNEYKERVNEVLNIKAIANSIKPKLAKALNRLRHSIQPYLAAA